MDKLIHHFKTLIECPYHQISLHYTKSLQEYRKKEKIRKRRFGTSSEEVIKKMVEEKSISSSYSR